MLEIRKYPDPILRRRARAIRRVDDAVRTLARDMIETMQQAGGAGLAANQVGVLRRLIVLQLPEEDPRVLVNPAITAREGSRQVEEGCLSVPGYTGLLERAVRVKARA
ncbi:MAG: peptide deformylase, partial [Gemmatimonadetes bacterium]|nr:peptide deformylase [Gemmatimonadota bacterium]